MKTIGLLGGTGWGSTVGYYTLLNQLVQERLGGFHSAKILLKSIDYHEIKTNYGKDNDHVACLLQTELEGLMQLQPDCVIICCNTLHKFYDVIRDRIQSSIPVMHAVDLVAQHAYEMGYKQVLFLGTRLTMEDGFFAKKLESENIAVTIPEKIERDQIQELLNHLIQKPVTDEIRNYFRELIKKHQNLDAVILGCTELPLAVTASSSVLPIIDPVRLQAHAAVEYVLN